MNLKTICISVLSIAITATGVSAKKKNAELRCTDMNFFATEEARRIGDQVLLYQRVTGGWPKNIDMARELDETSRARIEAEKGRRDDSTTDNDATIVQLGYLARLYKATGEEKYRDAFHKGIDFLLAGQYDNGGWPQFWPENRGYQIHITYNDNAMIGTMTVIRDLMYGMEPYDAPGLMPEGYRRKLMESFYRGVECILATQIVTDGKLTVWCQQHDRDTYAPAPARAYELPSYGSNESVGILRLLMHIPDPDMRIKRSVHAAMRWLDDHKITGYRYERVNDRGQFDAKIIADADAPAMWARFYDLVYGEPYVCDRDGIPRRHLHQIGYERRNGYGWYSNSVAMLYDMYDEWADRYDPEHKEKIDLNGPGGNERGIMNLDRRDAVDEKAFDTVVYPGGSIQDAIAKAPLSPVDPYKILVKNGTYNQKVIIDRPNIVLVGENRDSTVLVLAEKHSDVPKNAMYNGKPVGNGVIVLQEGADDCVISGMTVYNNYGTTVEKTTTHQMAIFGRGTRTIIVNCNVWADGNDALSLWSKVSDGGMYYHADLDIRCKGVDFLCPRGWCFATRCKFLGDGHALIWHDGRGDKSRKLVITDSDFDSQTPSPLGRYHHDSQFFLMNCHLSERVLDEDIRYAYTDKVLDPCPWGKRVYYLNCTREGGHSGWLADNFDKSEQSPLYHEVNARWTFDDRWDPESRVRSLWNVLHY
ncbi:MAG: pectate lyase [Bacteroides sp.]|nr:pectate lyase [Bacteroides sp.]